MTPPNHPDPVVIQRSRISGGRVDPAPPLLGLVIVDPHASVREGLPPLLRAEGIEVLAGAPTGDGGEALIGQHEPDVALIAFDLPDVDGMLLLRRLVQRAARSAIVLYTNHEDSRQAAVAMHAGAAGVVAKQRSIAELASALRTVAAGGLWFNEAGQAPALRETPIVLSDTRAHRRTAALSSSELRVLALVADGSSTEEVADTLSLSPHTVRTHLRNAMRKLEASSRAHAVAIAVREAAIEL